MAEQTSMDRLNALVEALREENNFSLLSSHHVVANSDIETVLLETILSVLSDIKSDFKSFRSSMADSYSEIGQCLAKSAHEMRQSYTRICDLLQEETDASESLDVDASESLDVVASKSYTDEMTTTPLQEDMDASEMLNANLLVPNLLCDVSKAWNDDRTASNKFFRCTEHKNSQIRVLKEEILNPPKSQNVQSEELPEDTIANATATDRGLSQKFTMPFDLDIAHLLISQARIRQHLYSYAFFDERKVVLVSVYRNLKDDITGIQQDSRFIPPDNLVICCDSENLGKDDCTLTTCLKECMYEMFSHSTSYVLSIAYTDEQQEVFLLKKSYSRILEDLTKDKVVTVTMNEIGTIARVEVIAPKLGIKLNYIDSAAGLVVSRVMSSTGGTHDTMPLRNNTTWSNTVGLSSISLGAITVTKIGPIVLQENVVLVNHKQVYAIVCIASAYLQVLGLEWFSKIDDEGTTHHVVDDMPRMLMCCLKSLFLGYITVGISYDFVTKCWAMVEFQLDCWVFDFLERNCGCCFVYYVLMVKKGDTNPCLRAIVITPPGLIHHFLGNSHDSCCFSKITIQGNFYGNYITGIDSYTFVGDIISDFIMARTGDFLCLAFKITLVSLGLAKLVDNVLIGKHPIEPMITNGAIINDCGCHCSRNTLLTTTYVGMEGDPLSLFVYAGSCFGLSMIDNMFNLPVLQENDSMGEINACKYTCLYVHMVLLEWYSIILIKELCSFVVGVDKRNSIKRPAPLSGTLSILNLAKNNIFVNLKWYEVVGRWNTAIRSIMGYLTVVEPVMGPHHHITFQLIKVKHGPSLPLVTNLKTWTSRGGSSQVTQIIELLSHFNYIVTSTWTTSFAIQQQIVSVKNMHAGDVNNVSKGDHGINQLAEMFSANCSLRFKQWDPGGASLVHEKSSLDLGAIFRYVTITQCYYLDLNLEDKVVLKGKVL